jgi:heterodisulfide reductase subunit C
LATKLDPKFKYEVTNLPGGQHILRCFQCGTCSAGCPVREIDEKYNPRKIIRMVILGMRDRVLSSEFIWLCTQCETCEERCPQDVLIPEVMDVIKNLAVKEGYIHEAFAKQAEIVGELGILYAISDFENKKRDTLGLPQLSQKHLEVSEIFKMTGLENKLQKNGEN